MSWINQYIEYLGYVNPDQLRIEEAQTIKMNNMPRFLYKFKGPNKCALDNLKMDTVWLNAPSNYNDPFECVVYTDIEKVKPFFYKTNDKILNYKIFEKHQMPDDLEKAIIKELDEVIGPFLLETKSEFNQDKMNNLDSILDKSFKKIANIIVQKFNRSVQETMKTCSFCEHFDSILMWSHYADCHKGFCIEYDLNQWQKDDIRRRLLYPVIYQNELFDFTDYLIQSIGYKKFNNLYAIISCATKSDQWKYEKEWRMIFNVGPGFNEDDYRMNCQKRVILGCRMDEDYKKEVISICQANKLEICQAKVSLKKYELEFEDIYKPP